jgi:arylsulfatase A-like enzyme
MIVTTDHGRNDDAHGGFEDHGKWNHGCRDLFFLAIGPGIRQNTVITNIDRDHIDIAPTVGYILGFPTPFSEGEVMREIFTSDFKSPLDCQPLKWDWEGGFDENLSNTSGFSREPDIAVDRNGRVHVVWVDNTRDKWEIYYWIQPDW